MKRIKALLPIDESEFSRQALAIATNTLNADNTDITLLRVISNPKLLEQPMHSNSLYGGVVDTKHKKPDSSNRLYLDELRANIAANLKNGLGNEIELLEAEGFSVGTEVRFGEPADEIIHEAEKQYDMIVMATHGRTGIKRVLLGSVAEKVMRNAEIPVMMYKPTPQDLENANAL